MIKSKIILLIIVFIVVNISLSYSSVGVTIGNTYFDAQHYGSMGRMVTWGISNSPDALFLHFVWTKQADRLSPDTRSYCYSSYDANNGTIGSSTSIQTHPDYGAYTGVDVTLDNRAIVGGHGAEVVGNHPLFYWDNSPGEGNFTQQCNSGSYEPAVKMQWPKFSYHDDGFDKYMHVLARVADDDIDGPGGLYYFRATDVEGLCIWDDPPVIVDTIFNYAYDIVASRTSGKVAITWMANLPKPGDCNTCSNNDGAQHPTMDNDIYYMTSDNNGFSWNSRQNVTMNSDGVEGFRPANDLSVLINENNKLHIVWPSRVWPANANEGGVIGDNCQIHHWSEETPYIRTVHDANWDQTTCDGGAFTMNVSKMSVSECGEKLYTLFVQFNDIPNGIDDDCSVRAYKKDADPIMNGAANGELFVSISTDNGMTWDDAQNISNTYSPMCDTIDGFGGPCDSENWPSMALFGTDYIGDWSAAEVIDPTGSYADDWFLDIQYIHDKNPGAIHLGEGFWQQADVNWLRLACVDPEPCQTYTYQPYFLDFPIWVKHGFPVDTVIIIENICNTTLSYIPEFFEITGPPGWLSISGFDGSISAGLAGTESGSVHINTGGIVNAPGTHVNLRGAVIINPTDPSYAPDTIPIDVWVLDTILDLAPVLSPIGSQITNEGDNLNFTITSTDIDGTPPVVSASSLPGGSSFIDNLDGTGTFDWTPGYSDAGMYTVSFYAINEFFTDSEQVEIIVNEVSICADKIINIDFNSDVIDSPPNTDPPGDPTGDFVLINDDNGAVLVRSSIGTLTNKPVEIDDTSPQQSITSFTCSSNQPSGSDSVIVKWKSLLSSTSIYSGISLLDDVGTDITGILYSNSELRLDTALTPIGYTNGIGQLFELKLNFIDQITSLSIDGVPVTGFQSHPFYTSAANLKSILFYTAEGAFVVDDIEVCDYSSCCLVRGDALHDNQLILVNDLVFLVNHVFKGGPPPLCIDEGDALADNGLILVNDLVYLVNHVFKGGPPPPPC